MPTEVFKYLNAFRTMVWAYGVLNCIPYVCSVVLPGIAEVLGLGFQICWCP